MNFDAIHFPIQGTIQKFVHFSDESHEYAFSFASPFIYDEPLEYKQKRAFLIGKYNPFNPNPHAPTAIYSTFTLDGQRTNYPVPKTNLKVQKVKLANDADQPMGSMEILYPKSRLFHFNPQIPNLIYNVAGEAIGFCLFQPKLYRKSVFSFKPSFKVQCSELDDDNVRELENDGTIRCHFAYELVRRDSGFRNRLAAWFSPEKKTEMIMNRINMIQRPETNEQALLSMTALLAFFWFTVVDFPLTEE